MALSYAALVEGVDLMLFNEFDDRTVSWHVWLRNKVGGDEPWGVDRLLRHRISVLRPRALFFPCSVFITTKSEKFVDRLSITPVSFSTETPRGRLCFEPPITFVISAALLLSAYLSSASST